MKVQVKPALKWYQYVSPLQTLKQRTGLFDRLYMSGICECIFTSLWVVHYVIKSFFI